MAGNAGVSLASANHEHFRTKNVNEKAERRPLVQAGRLHSRRGFRTCRESVILWERAGGYYGCGFFLYVEEIFQGA